MNNKYTIILTKQSKKDIQLLKPKEKEKLKKILVDVIAEDPFLGKRLVGDLEGNFSYRLNIKDRIVYSVNKEDLIVYVKRTRTHYGE